jgi:transcriptional regulator with XRE-family HTH domain
MDAEVGVRLAPTVPPTSGLDGMEGSMDEEKDVSGFSAEVGTRLRGVRRAKALSLDDVERLSGGRWSASAIGAYERGFRNLSLPRLREIALFYDVPMSVLLGEVETLSGGPVVHRLRLDLERMRTIPDANPVWRYLQTIIRERGDYNGRVLTVRRDDARALCAVLHVDEPGLAEKLSEWGVLVD